MNAHAQFQTSDFRHWKDTATARGYSFCPEGALLIAHDNGDERGQWDNNYCSGFGWLYNND